MYISSACDVVIELTSIMSGPSGMLMQRTLWSLCGRQCKIKKVQLSGSTKAGVIPKFMVAIMVTSILRSGTHVRKKKQSVWRL